MKRVVGRIVAFAVIGYLAILVVAYAAGIAGGQAGGERGKPNVIISLPGTDNAKFTVGASRRVGLGGQLLGGFRLRGDAILNEWEVRYLGKDGAGARHLRIRETDLLTGRHSEQFEVMVAAADSKAFALTALGDSPEPILVKVSMQDEGAAVVSASVLKVVVVELK